MSTHSKTHYGYLSMRCIKCTRPIIAFVNGDFAAGTVHCDIPCAKSTGWVWHKGLGGQFPGKRQGCFDWESWSVVQFQRVRQPANETPEFLFAYGTSISWHCHQALIGWRDPDNGLHYAHIPCSLLAGKVQIKRISEVLLDGGAQLPTNRKQQRDLILSFAAKAKVARCNWMNDASLDCFVESAADYWGNRIATEHFPTRRVSETSAI